MGGKKGIRDGVILGTAFFVFPVVFFFCLVVAKSLCQGSKDGRPLIASSEFIRLFKAFVASLPVSLIMGALAGAEITRGVISPARGGIWPRVLRWIFLQEGGAIFFALIPVAWLARPNLLAKVLVGLACFRLFQFVNRGVGRYKFGVGYLGCVYGILLAFKTLEVCLCGGRNWNDQFLFLAIGGLLLADILLVFKIHTWRAQGLLASGPVRPLQFSLGQILFALMAVGFLMALFLALFRPGGL